MKRIVFDYAVTAYIFSLYLGSIFYVANTFITPMNLLLPIIFFIALFSIIKANICNYIWVLVVATCLTLLVCILNYSYRDGGDDNSLKSIFYFIHGVSIIFIAVAYDIGNSSIDFFKIVAAGVAVNFFISVAQLLINLGYLPRIDFLVTNELYESIVLINGGFGNPNNLAFAMLMSAAVLLIWYVNDGLFDSKLNGCMFWLSFVMIFIVIIMTMSRLATLLLVVIFTLSLIKRREFVKLSISFFVMFFLVVFLVVFFGDNDLISRNIEKAESMFSGVVDDESSDLRLSLYSFMVLNLFSYPTGFGFSNYSEPLSQFDKYEDFLAISPHSFLYEFILSAGYIGICFVLSLFYANIKKSLILGFFSVVIYYSSFLLISNIPSSLIKMPLCYIFIMLPFFLRIKLRFSNNASLVGYVS